MQLEILLKGDFGDGFLGILRFLVSLGLSREDTKLHGALN